MIFSISDQIPKIRQVSKNALKKVPFSSNYLSLNKSYVNIGAEVSDNRTINYKIMKIHRCKINMSFVTLRITKIRRSACVKNLLYPLWFLSELIGLKPRLKTGIHDFYWYINLFLFVFFWNNILTIIDCFQMTEWQKLSASYYFVNIITITIITIVTLLSSL